MGTDESAHSSSRDAAAAAEAAEAARVAKFRYNMADEKQPSDWPIQLKMQVVCDWSIIQDGR